jgi:DNA repair ATPase RecN
MAELPPFIKKDSVKLGENEHRVRTLYDCSLCRRTFYSVTPEEHCASNRHIANFQEYRDNKEERKRKLEKQIEELRTKFQEKEDAITNNIKRESLLRIQKKKEDIILCQKIRYTT